MLGPGDAGPTPTGAFVLKVMRGELKFVLPGWHRLVDARDVAWAAAEAITRGRPGERYVLGGRRWSVAEVFQAVSRASGAPVPAKVIPPRRLLLASRVMALAARFTGRPPPLKPSIVRRLQEPFSFRSDKAERELGVRFRSLETSVADTVGWFEAEHRGHGATGLAAAGGARAAR
jgi:nucleoside-diphosphate-sugar epimerase